mmetsp:Transcript_30289/g.54212  ORF Transcript_30289/g.54212 Transcript_30289/m.54212 type:complete len:223 (+) Transcript_30289:373-1041(+)
MACTLSDDRKRRCLLDPLGMRIRMGQAPGSADSGSSVTTSRAFSRRAFSANRNSSRFLSSASISARMRASSSACALAASSSTFRCSSRAASRCLSCSNDSWYSRSCCSRSIRLNSRSCASARSTTSSAPCSSMAACSPALNTSGLHAPPWVNTSRSLLLDPSSNPTNGYVVARRLDANAKASLNRTSPPQATTCSLINSTISVEHSVSRQKSAVAGCSGAWM